MAKNMVRTYLHFGILELPLTKWMVYNGQSQSQMDDLGVPPISGNLHIPILSPLPSGNLTVSY